MQHIDILTVAISWPRNRTWVSYMAGRFFTNLANSYGNL